MEDILDIANSSMKALFAVTGSICLIAAAIVGYFWTEGVAENRLEGRIFAGCYVGIALSIGGLIWLYHRDQRMMFTGQKKKQAGFDVILKTKDRE